MPIDSMPTWSLILAGGDGLRLRPLTMQISGDARPKQFCPIFDGETLIDRTRRRAALVSRDDREVVVVSRHHEPYYRALHDDLAPGRLVVQPANRGTGPGILYPLLRIAELAGNAPVVIMPSDHYIGDDHAFCAHVTAAVQIVAQHRGHVLLLGIDPDLPETEYGWIEPGELPLLSDVGAAYPVRRFWEKPSARLAETLLERGCLWNSFVMVGWVSTFLDLIGETLPDLVGRFAPLTAALGSSREEAVAQRVYGALDTVNFSEAVLEAGTRRLATMRVKGVEWSDWGHPTRVVASLRRAGRRPSWLGQVELASTA